MVKQSRFGPFDHEDEGTTIIPNVRKLFISQLSTTSQKTSIFRNIAM